MSDEPAILAENLSKSYRAGRSVTDVPIPRGFPGSGLRGRRRERERRDVDDDEEDELEERPHDLEQPAEREDEETAATSGRIVHALRDVSLEVRRGARLAVLGPAGSGKSTLLKVVARITPPTEGRVVVRGRVSPPLELAASFLNPNATGRQNAIIVARLFGLPKRLVEPQLDDIFALAGITEKLDHRVATYSNRQYRRLAISVALHLQPDVLLIDDRLASTDEEFAARVQERLMQASATGQLTILFAATEVEAVSGICDEAIWLADGRIVERRRLEQATPAGAPRPRPQPLPQPQPQPQPQRGSVPGPSGLDGLDPSQRELVHELVARGRTYEQLAAERGTTVGRVRADAQRMLATVAPDGGRLEPELREAIGDYMLGQSQPDPAELERLAATPQARHWPVVIGYYLKHLAPAGLPAFPLVPGPAGYEGFVPPPEPAAAVLVDYLAIALGSDRARDAFAAATDKAIWKAASRVSWADVSEAAGFDHHEAKAVTQRLLATRSAQGLPDPDRTPFGEGVSIAGATLRSADGLPVQSVRRSEDVMVETVVDATGGHQGVRVELVLEARGLDPVHVGQPQEFTIAAAGRYHVVARFSAALLDPAEYRARVVVDVERDGHTSQVKLRDAFAFETLDTGEELDAGEDSDAAADVRWHVSP
ncbi:MAG: ABC transporter ATP-binding protein [Solirubrobacteraceae bacterium]